ncbi:uncharacterized protein V2V93DRAFT_372026 [Kockiozyma suomiensis]|uniref:uncharacterized protein n=1 Tax=Kockiozyma suomiensis TaxID=1337062 RepID=UPI003343F22D
MTSIAMHGLRLSSLNFTSAVAILLLCVTSPVSAGSAYCKCTCFSNSTLVRMADETQGCLDCTRSFCLENNLPVCKDAEDVDVSATCYQRDSAKDEIVVILFIVVACGLIANALIRAAKARYLERRQGNLF